MAAGDELLTQRSMVVNFAVENDPESAIFVADGLMTSDEVDDAQPAHAKSNTALLVYAFVIRAAMYHCPAHLTQNSGIDLAILRKPHHSSDSAHDKCQCSSRDEIPYS
jgi:hypothetical protein